GQVEVCDVDRNLAVGHRGLSCPRDVDGGQGRRAGRAGVALVALFTLRTLWAVRSGRTCRSCGPLRPLGPGVALRALRPLLVPAERGFFGTATLGQVRLAVVDAQLAGLLVVAAVDHAAGVGDGGEGGRAGGDRDDRGGGDCELAFGHGVLLFGCASADGVDADEVDAEVAEAVEQSV